MNYLLYKSRKAIFVAGLLIVISAFSSAQQLRTSYFMDKSTVRTALNPAFRPERGYVSIPVLGALNVSYVSNGISLSDVLYPKNGKLVTFMDQSVSADAFLKKLKTNNQINTDFATSILSAGWYHGNGFWTVDLNIKGVASARLPKTLFEFMKKGSGAEGTVYDISNINMYADSYVEAAVGYSRPVNDKLTVGGKLKFLAGAANMDAHFDYIHVEMNEDVWKINSIGRMNASVKGLTPEFEVDNKDKEYINSFDFDSPGIAGFGSAIDLGASYQLLDNLTLSASVLDLGFISWGASSTTAGIADGNGEGFTFPGFTLPIGDNNSGNSMSDQFSEMTDNLTDLFHFRQQESKGRTTMLRSTINFGAEYSLFDNRLGFGLLSSTRFYTPRAFTELTASANYRPVDWFAASLSYSFIHSDFKTFGFALNFSPSWINFFIGTDYMLTKVTPQFVPVDAHTANVFFGLSIPLRGRGY